MEFCKYHGILDLAYLVPQLVYEHGYYVELYDCNNQPVFWDGYYEQVDVWVWVQIGSEPWTSSIP